MVLAVGMGGDGFGHVVGQVHGGSGGLPWWWVWVIDGGGGGLLCWLWLVALRKS